MPIALRYASKMREAAFNDAEKQSTPEERFYLDALVATLDKIIADFPIFFPNLKKQEKYSILDSLRVNYDVIHLDHERRVSLQTRLKKDEPLTREAVLHFYQQKASQEKIPSAPRNVVLHHNILQRRNHTNPSRPEFEPLTTGEKRAFFQERYPARMSRAPHAVILFHNGLYHFNHSDPQNPMLTLIVPPAVSDATEEGQRRRNAYAQLKKKISSYDKDKIFKAEEERAWMASLLGAPITDNKAWRPVDLDLIIAFLGKWNPCLKQTIQQWQDMKKLGIALVILSAGFLVLLSIAWCLLTMVLLLTNLVVLLKIIGVMTLAVLGLSAGLAAYCHMQTVLYQNILKDFNVIDYVKTYKDDEGLPMQTLIVQQELSLFFVEHKVSLDIPYTPPVSAI